MRNASLNHAADSVIPTNGHMAWTESRTRGTHWIFSLLYVNNLPPTLPVILSSQMARSTLIHWEWFWCSSICIFWHMWKFKPCSLSGTQLQKQWIVDAWEILGLLYFQALCWSPIYSYHSGIFSTLLIPSLLLSFFFSFLFFFFCALFLPCIPPLKSHWCSGSAPSQAGKPMLVLQCPLPQILCLHRVTWMPSLAGLTLIFPYLSLFSS